MKRIILNDKIISFTENPSLRYVTARIKNRSGRDTFFGEGQTVEIEALNPKQLASKLGKIFSGQEPTNDTLKTIPDPMQRTSAFWN